MAVHKAVAAKAILKAVQVVTSLVVTVDIQAANKISQGHNVTKPRAVPVKEMLVAKDSWDIRAVGLVAEMAKGLAVPHKADSRDQEPKI